MRVFVNNKYLKRDERISNENAVLFCSALLFFFIIYIEYASITIGTFKQKSFRRFLKDFSYEQFRNVLDLVTWVGIENVENSKFMAIV